MACSGLQECATLGAVPGACAKPRAASAPGVLPAQQLPPGPAVPVREMGVSGCCRHLFKAAKASGFAPLPMLPRWSAGPQMNSGRGQFPYKGRKELEGRTGPPVRQSSLPCLPTGTAAAVSSRRDASGTVRGRNFSAIITYLPSPQLESSGPGSFSTSASTQTV